MHRLRLAMLVLVALFAMVLLGASMTGAVVGTAFHADELTHIGMLLLLVAGLLGSLEVHLAHRRREENSGSKTD